MKFVYVWIFQQKAFMRHIVQFSLNIYTYTFLHCFQERIARKFRKYSRISNTDSYNFLIYDFFSISRYLYKPNYTKSEILTQIRHIHKGHGYDREMDELFYKSFMAAVIFDGNGARQLKMT